MFTRLWLVTALALLVGACSEITVDDYADNAPTFALESFFSGTLSAHGVVKNRAGKVIRYFNADIQASWQDGIGTLDERFEFDDGEIQRRVWTLQPLGDGRYRGSAGDVVGPATITSAGNALFLDYVLRIPWRDDTIDVTIDDRMYRVSQRVVINESIMTKFGIRVGSLLLVIEKQP